MFHVLVIVAHISRQILEAICPLLDTTVKHTSVTLSVIFQVNDGNISGNTTVFYHRLNMDLEVFYLFKHLIVSAHNM